MYYIYTEKFDKIDSFSQYAEAYNTAKELSVFLDKPLLIYYNTNFNIKVTPN